jgi:hypothetical protein
MAQADREADSLRQLSPREKEQLNTLLRKLVLAFEDTIGPLHKR